MSEFGDIPPPVIPPGEDGRKRASESDDFPPPVFAPGSDRAQALRAELDESARAVPDDAFIDPDEPLRRRSAISDDAFIDPDAPIVRARPPEVPDDFERVLRGESDLDMEVMVTGMGDDPHLDDEDMRALRTYGDPQMVDLVRMVGELARALEDKGEAGLRATPAMSRFETTLRAYCTGYLAGQREFADRGF
ncbi:MAG TPA: hypothetical protein VGA70_01320 [Longimicrobiales bacterium]|jgi:hypothetical protein